MEETNNWCENYINYTLKSKKIAFLASCIAGGFVFRYDSQQSPSWIPIIRFFNDAHVLIQQMYCPEHSFFGYPRDAATKDMYDTQEYRAHCQVFAEKVIEHASLPIFKDKELYFIGVKRSPTCACSKTTIGKSMQEAEIVDGKGIFVEELEKALQKHGLEAKFIDVDFRNVDFDELKKKLEI